MADAYIPRIERAFRQMQKPRFKVCDRAAMALLGVITLSFVMFAAGSAVLSIPVMGFNASADVNKLSPPAPNGTRSHRRLVHRVKGVMRSNCLSKDDIVFGGQVLVNSKPYLHALVYVCNNSLMLDNIMQQIPPEVERISRRVAKEEGIKLFQEFRDNFNKLSEGK